MANRYYSAYFKRITNKHDEPVKAALDAMIETGVRQYEYEPNGELQWLPTKEMTTALTALHIDAGTRWARYTDKDIKRKVSRKSAAIDNYNAFMREYLNRYLLSRSVKPIEETQRKIMAEIIAQGVEEGIGTNKIAARLRGLTANPARAKLITRTETGRAMNTGAMLAAANSNLELNKVWDSAQNNRTRRVPRNQTDHLRMNGISVPFYQPFFVPGVRGFEAMMYPCDAQGSAMNVCNCRCAVSFVPTGRVKPTVGGNEFDMVINFVLNNIVTLNNVNILGNG
jgi:hypothetical protein